MPPYVRELVVKAAMIVCVMLLASPALASDQFDLLCEGTVQSRVNGPQEPITQRFSFDLASNRFCKTTTFRGEVFNERCENVLNIAEVTSDRITLLKDVPGTIYYIDRQSGDLTHIMRSAYKSEHGHCELADYRPLPSARF